MSNASPSRRRSALDDEQWAKATLISFVVFLWAAVIATVYFFFFARENPKTMGHALGVKQFKGKSQRVSNAEFEKFAKAIYQNYAKRHKYSEAEYPEFYEGFLDACNEKYGEIALPASALMFELLLNGSLEQVRDEMTKWIENAALQQEILMQMVKNTKYHDLLRGVANHRYDQITLLKEIFAKKNIPANVFVSTSPNTNCTYFSLSFMVNVLRKMCCQGAGRKQHQEEMAEALIKFMALAEPYYKACDDAHIAGSAGEGDFIFVPTHELSAVPFNTSYELSYWLSQGDAADCDVKTLVLLRKCVVAYLKMRDLKDTGQTKELDSLIEVRSRKKPFDDLNDLNVESTRKDGGAAKPASGDLSPDD